ncbi:hypothetical protein QR77_14705 [Streptomyces sp. 150FB]|uniref:chaplin n=1 Tax=Streptomyces sp. 150FB TaxID=1576605 RepID=UPI0005896D5B|nr:hypothetical protein QR77_14705 [Streptomyces sp. 150FB]
MRDLISKGLLTAAAATSVLSMGNYAQAADASGAAVGSPGVLSGNTIQAPVDVPVNVCGNSIDVVGLLNPAFGNGCANNSHAPHHSSHPSHATPQDQAPRPGPAVHTAPAPRPASDDSSAYGNPPSHQPPHSRPSSQNNHGGYGGHDHHGGGSHADGSMVGSPGVGSGNGIQAPVDVPVNLCGNSVDVVGLLNPVFGNHCAVNPDEATSVHHTPPAPHSPHSPPAHHPTPNSPAHTVPGDDRAVPPPPYQVPNHPEPMLPVVKSVHEIPAQRAELAHTGADQNLLAGAAGISTALIVGGAILYRRSGARARV